MLSVFCYKLYSVHTWIVTVATPYSIINLMIITVERYLKVVHPFWSKKHLKNWMIYAAMVFAWVGGILLVMPVAFVTTIVDNGACMGFFVWESPTMRMALFLWGTFWDFIIPVTLFVYCYARIVVVIKRQMRVMAAHNVEGSAQTNASQLQSKRIKWNIIKTMIIVSVAYVICFFPTSIFFVIVDISVQLSIELMVGYNAAVFLCYLYICMNPFIYATKHEGVKQKLARLMVCRKRVEEISAGDTQRSNVDSRSKTGRTQQSNTGTAHQP